MYENRNVVAPKSFDRINSVEMDVVRVSAVAVSPFIETNDLSEIESGIEFNLIKLLSEKLNFDTIFSLCTNASSSCFE